jgi:hypothetical protein
MSLKRNLALLVAMLGILAVVSCSPMGKDTQQAHTCNQEQAGCSGD